MNLSTTSSKPLIRRSFFGLAVVVLLTSLAIPARAEGDAKLAKTTGKVWVTPPGGRESRASQGSTVKAGSKLRTGSSSEAELRFANGSVLRIRPNTSMSISGHKRNKRKKSSVMLFFGRLWSKVVSTEERSYEVKTPNAVCGVRGTEFETAVGDDGSVRVRVGEGSVGVGDAGKENLVNGGQQLDANEEGIADAGEAEERAKWEMWEKRKRERLEQKGGQIVGRMKDRIESRQERLEALRKRQIDIEGRRKNAEQRARSGDRRAIDEIRQYNQELAELSDEIADIGDEAESQFAIVDHFADIASRFKMVNRKHLEAEAASLRRVKAQFDKMVAEGTDISIEAMDALLDDMGKGSRSTLKDGKGSTVEDLFDGDDMFK